MDFLIGILVATLVVLTIILMGLFCVWMAIEVRETYGKYKKNKNKDLF